MIRRAMLLPAAALSSLLVLTWLLLHGVDDKARAFQDTFAALDRIELAESALLRDVLSARAGLLQNYDPLVSTVRALEASMAELLHARIGPAALSGLVAWRAREDALLEEFKSANALLQNSLAQFSQIAGSLAGPASGASELPDAGSLASAMLRFALNASTEAAAEVRRGLDALALAPLAPGNLEEEPEPLTAIMAHGHLLLDLLPRADQALRGLLAATGEPERRAVRAAVLDRETRSRRVANAYRVALYGASVLLLACLFGLGLELRARSLAQARRAEFEHMLADISTGFIAAGPEEVRTQVERGLGRIAAHLGATRAYLLLRGQPSAEYLWQEQPPPQGAGWPSRAWSLAAHFGRAGRSLVRVTPTDRLPAGLRGTLAHAGLQGWIAALRSRPDGEATALLGCDIAAPGGQMPSEAELAPLRLALDAVAHVVERASLEQEQARLEAHLQQSRRMELLGSFASGIAHNFNNILGAILGYTDMAEETAAGGDQHASSLKEIRRAGARARDLVTRILDFGRGRAMSRAPVVAGELLEEAAALLRASLPAEVRLRIASVPETAILAGDAAQLQQVILNLGGNAAQAMDGAGTLDIGVEERCLARPRRLDQGQLTAGRYVVLSVSDDGKGIDAALRRRIFEPFFSGRAGGHGLGLATVREIVLGHGGAIGLDSLPGNGSRFDVWLPAAGPSDFAAAGLASPEIAFGSGETVLLIDSVAARLPAEEEQVAALGYEPAGFCDAVSALQALRAAPDRFDLALLCDPAPGQARSRLMEALRSVRPDLPVVLAASPAPAAHGANEIVAWPIAPEDLARALKGALLSRSVGFARAG